MRAQAVFLHLPRHPLLRMLALAAGAIVLAGLVAMSLVVGAAVLVAASAWLLARRWLVRRRRPRGDPDVIEGEFTVMPKRPSASLPRVD